MSEVRYCQHVPDCDIPYGYCHCECGEKTPLHKSTARTRGEIKGEPKRYIRGHHRAKTGPEYEIRDLGHETPCWIWLRAKNSGGYGNLYVRGSKPRLYDYAHHIYYERAHGPIPVGYEVDHLCHNPLCVNPDHLEAVPKKVNIARQRSHGPAVQRPTHCKHGHEYTPENTIPRPNGGVSCRICGRKAWRDWAAKRKS